MPQREHHRHRRVVSAVRDFPTNCGPLFSKLVPQFKRTAAEAETEVEAEGSNSTNVNDNNNNNKKKKKKPPLCSRDFSVSGPLNNKNNVVSASVNKDLREHTERRFNRNDRVKVSSLSSLRLSSSSRASSGDVARDRVRSTLRLFHAVCRCLDNKDLAPGQGVSLLAYRALQDSDRFVNTGKQIIGTVPGVQVGDEFQYWREMIIIGLHRQVLRGIDYVEHRNGKILATSVVLSGSYDDEMESTDELVYSGQGGNLMKKGSGKRKPKDQKLTAGNLALKNSFEVKNPVRVILKAGSKDVGGSSVYAYYGLYEVEKYWQEIGSHGKLVYKFRLVRLAGQVDVAWNELRKSKSLKTRNGLCVDDVSYGKESIPVCVINTVDGEGVPLFEYVTHMVYPKWCNPKISFGCACVDGCSDSQKCLCAVRNGGRIAYNKNKAIMAPKSIVYECGPFCKCSSTCHNRVSQNGIGFKLEIFRTKTKGWGVRSHNSIPSGSFICEYTGELLKDKEAEKRVNCDEYLFDVGNYYNDHSLWQELSTIVADAEASPSSSFPVSEDNGFTIDAAHYGNVARFINHSCSPNLFAQNVLYDHDDKRIPHIMLFAGENIPRMQELTYHYNCKIDQVFDSNGNIKKKKCYCGALECTGRMY